MGNAVALLGLILQNLNQLQSYASTVHAAIADGRDVSDAELAAARTSLTSHLDALQQAIDARRT